MKSDAGTCLVSHASSKLASTRGDGFVVYGGLRTGDFGRDFGVYTGICRWLLEDFSSCYICLWELVRNLDLDVALGDGAEGVVNLGDD